MNAHAEPHLFVVFGATGDLMRRKLLPALYHLYAEGVVNDRSCILGADRPTAMGDAGFRTWARERLGVGPANAFCSERLHYQPMGPAEAMDFQVLAARLAKLEHDHHLPGNRVFYLALPPSAFPSVIVRLGEAGLNRSSGWTRLVIEKPFGCDLASAQELNRLIHRYFEESQVYRIDHYLGKETVQNLLLFRFANPLFEAVWNRDRVERVEITVAESLGVEHRAAYYEGAGALRDMVQNHLTQLLSVAAMELPAAFDADSIRYEKSKVLHAIAPVGPENAVFGQYTRGKIDGTEVTGYREEPGVSSDSAIETFAAVKLEIANWRWYGVPFYLHTGKRLPRRVSQIAVTFRHPLQPSHTVAVHPNVLVITLQPDEGFDLQFDVKEPGQPIRLQTQRLHFRYAEAFVPLPDAYETLLLDVLIGDQTLFVHADWVESSWRLYSPLLDRRPPIQPYPAGTWGPPDTEHVSWLSHSMTAPDRA